MLRGKDVHELEEMTQMGLSVLAISEVMGYDRKTMDSPQPRGLSAFFVGLSLVAGGRGVATRRAAGGRAIRLPLGLTRDGIDTVVIVPGQSVLKVLDLDLVALSFGHRARGFLTRLGCVEVAVDHLAAAGVVEAVRGGRGHHCLLWAGWVGFIEAASISYTMAYWPS